MDLERLTCLPITDDDEVLKLLPVEAERVDVQAAFEYDRKDFLTYDDVAGERNKSYGSSRDDILCAITFRVKAGTPEWDALKALGDKHKRQTLEAQANNLRSALEGVEAKLEELK